MSLTPSIKTADGFFGGVSQTSSTTLWDPSPSSSSADTRGYNAGLDELGTTTYLATRPGAYAEQLCMLDESSIADAPKLDLILLIAYVLWESFNQEMLVELVEDIQDALDFEEMRQKYAGQEPFATRETTVMAKIENVYTREPIIPANDEG